MQQIFKYELDLNGAVRIEMPLGAKILAVQEQNGIPCIWALVTTGEGDPPVLRHFRIIGTGHTIAGDVGVYIGTFQLFGGEFVGHVFEVKAS